MIYPFKVDTFVPPNSVIPKVGDVVWYVHSPQCISDCQSEAVVIKLHKDCLSPNEGIWLRIKFPRLDWGTHGEYDCYSNKCYPMKTQKGNTIVMEGHL